MNRLLVHLVFAIPFISFSCGNPSIHPVLPGYDIKKPELSITLPDTLHEISGLVPLDSSLFACVQDELGTLFMFDISSGQIVSYYNFGPPGDYEAVTRVGSTIYVLRSDGVIFEVLESKNGKRKTDIHFSYIPAKDNEGLCYDKAGNRLLIGCKSKHGDGPEYKNIRAIYAFDLKTKKISSNPAFIIRLEDVLSFASANNVPVPLKTKGKNVVPDLKLRISELSIHPVTGEIYVLAAEDFMLLVLSPKGVLLHAEMLNEEIFNKAEGIGFLENGDMFISNEGGEGKATIHRFNFSRKS